VPCRKVEAGAPRRERRGAIAATGIIHFSGGMPISDDERDANDAHEGAPSEPAPATKRTLGLAGLLLELLLPVVLSAAILLAVASKVSWWDLRAPVGLGAFAILLVLASLFVSVRVDGFTLARRQRRGKRQLLNRTGARARLVKFALGGVVIPIAALFAANRVELPGFGTPMALLLKTGLMRPAATVAARTGFAVRHAGSTSLKVDGIRALQAMATPEALDELWRIATEDPGAMRGGAESAALARAIAAFGAAATPRLLELIGRLSPEERLHASGPASGGPGRDLAPALDALKDEIEGSSDEPATRATRLSRLAGARAELDELESEVEAAPHAGGSPAAAFVLDTFLAMSAKDDDELLAFARTTIADAGWSAPVRGQAMLLLAKLGGQDDVARLAAFLDAPDAVLRAHAMQALAALEAKLSAGA